MTDDSRDPQAGQRHEPSVLDYLKSRLSFGARPAIEIPAPEAPALEPLAARELPSPRPQTTSVQDQGLTVRWRSVLALGLSILGQSFFEPPRHSAAVGSVLYAAALGFLVWATVRGEWSLAPLLEATTATDPLTYRRRAFIFALPMAALAFLLFGGNLFTGFNVSLWFAALALLAGSLWLRDPRTPSAWQRLRTFAGRGSWHIRVDRWMLLLVAAALVVGFFRLYHIQQTPAEPFSDHAEKLLDIYDVSQGQTHIFFPRNTGREAIQMYVTLAISWVFGTGLSFLSLKLGTVLIGLLALPFVYLLGREIASPRVGLLAFLLAGIGYWPNVISRVGLRFPLYPLFVAPLLLFLIRGLRTRNRNDFIWAGLFLGLGLHGYSPFRIVPLLVVTAFVLYVLHAQSRGVRKVAWVWLVITGLMALIIFLPLLRYAIENPDSFSYRALTRLGSIEQPLPGPWYQVFLSNTWNALRMFNWDNGTIWVHSLPDRPALDMVTGALFLIGITLLLLRYIRARHWLDLFLLLSIPILLLPSILSLAFPDENPSLNRTAGALVPVFLIAALALDGLITALVSAGRRNVTAYALIGLLVWGSAVQNFDLVFRQFDDNFRKSAWNSSEMGAVIKEFGLAFGETDTAWVIPFPYWVDTRLVGVWAGIPNRDFAMWPDRLAETQQFSGPRLFIAKADLENASGNDKASLDLLKGLYPQGSLALHRSASSGHDFWVYFVPAASSP